MSGGSGAVTSPLQGEGGLSGRTASRAVREHVAQWSFLACALLAATVAAVVVGVLAWQTVAFFADVPLARFLTDTVWSPFSEQPRVGVLPLLVATAQITAGAAVFAVPAGVATAVYLVHYAGARSARFLSALTMLLAGVPTVVLGYFALESVTPFLKVFWPATEAYNGLSACLVVGLMTLPTVSVLSRQALAAVPRSLVDAGLALGASRGKVVVQVAAPAARRGIAAAVVLAVVRAAGETMIVTMAAGSQARLAWSPLEGLQTLTAFVAQAGMSSAGPGSPEHRAVFAAATTLFLLTFAIHAAGRWLLAGAARVSPRARLGAAGP